MLAGYPPGTKEILRGCKYDKLSGSVCFPEDVDKCEGVGSNVVCEKVKCFYIKRYSYESCIV